MGLGALIAKLGVDITGWRHGWKQAEGVARKSSKDIGAFTKGQLAGMFGAGAIGAAVKNTVEYAGRIRDMSDALGISTDTLQQMDFAATQSGASLESFTGSMVKLGKAQQEAVNDPGGGAAAAFQKLGISMEQVKSMKIEDLFFKVGRAFKDAKNPQEMLAAGIKVMGRGADEVFPAMVGGLEETMMAAQTLGQVMGEDVIDALDDVGDKFDELKGRARTGVGQIGVWALNAANWAAKEVEYAAKFWGAGVGNPNMTPAEAVAEADRLTAGEDAAGISATASKKARREAARAAGRLVVDETPIEATTAKGGGVGGATVTGWQQIGAFAFTNPLLEEQKNANRLLTRIEKNTKPIGPTLQMPGYDGLFTE